MRVKEWQNEVVFLHEVAPGAADRYQLMAAGRILRQQRLEDLERVVQNCR